MDITPTFKLGDVKKKLDQSLQNLDAAIIQTLSYLGEQCVIQARGLSTYQDQTGNLRASIGYVIVRNGAVIRENFIGNGAGTGTGSQLARSKANDIPKGWGLIVVAGMNYAVAVESRRLDVLTSAEQLATVQLPGLMAQLKSSIGK